MYRGYIKLYRKLQDWTYYKNSKHVHLWVHLLLEATHKPYTADWKGEKITLQPGQFITGRHRLSRETGLQQHFIDRSLRRYESEQQIEQQKTPKGSMITILNWESYAGCEQPSEQRMSNERATSEQRMSTKQEVKNVKNVKNNKYNGEINDIINDLNEVCSTNYRASAEDTQKKITKLLEAGFGVDDFRRVHRTMAEVWKDNPDMEQFLRPSTLYSNKFEAYLNKRTFDEMAQAPW